MTNIELTDYDIKAKKTFNKVGLFLFIVAFISSALEIILQKVLPLILGENSPFIGSTLYILLLSTIPLYLIAFPIGYIVLNNLEVDNKNIQKIELLDFIEYFLMCIPIMYFGSIIGSLLSSALTDGLATNPIDIFLNWNPILKIVVIAIIAPIMEEFVFRKVLIDHTAMYGEKYAVFFSALAFGLFHMNMFQFFYAFGVGLIFAYVYTKTRTIKYSAIMHMIINFFGSIVAPYFIKNSGLLDFDAEKYITMNSLEQLEALKPMYGLFIYLFSIFVLFIAGLIILIIKRKSFTFEEGDYEISKHRHLKTIYINAGVIVFFIFTIAMSLVSLFIK